MTTSFALKASHHYSKHEATKNQTAATLPGCYYDGKLPEPRKRTGDTGRPAHEVQAAVPSFEYSLPTVWGGLDGDDPPIFESQAAYLKHHGLLLAGEERRADFEPVAVLFSRLGENTQVARN